jgi:serine phosphatase RsbU (regulator of sigma subunit)
VCLIVGIAATLLLMSGLAQVARPWHLLLAQGLAAVGMLCVSVPGRERRVPLRRRDLPLTILSVFVTFASLGPLMMIVFSPVPANALAGVVSAVMAGTFAVLWSSSFLLRQWWLLLVVIPAQVYVPGLLFDQLDRWGLLVNFGGLSPTSRTGIQVAIVLACIVLGYVLVAILTRRIEREHARATAELDVAARVHKSLVPPIDMHLGSLHILARSDASSQMGGDLVDVVYSPDRVDVILGDVSGHGIGAGIVMGILKSAIRTKLRSGGELSETVGDVNAVLEELTDSSTFATFVCMRFSTRTHTEAQCVEVVLAGHLPVFVIRSGSGRVEEISNQNLPLGIDKGERFVSVMIQINPGDTLAVLSDGLTEVQNTEGKELGLAQMRAVLMDGGRSSGPISSTMQAVFDAARQHGRQIDDQSLVLVRVVQ